MAIPFDKKYSDPKYTNPSDNIDYRIKRGINLNTDTEQVRKQWFLDKCEYLYSAYLRGDCYIPYTQNADMVLNRLYAQGMQPIDKYKERLTEFDAKTGKRKGWMNLSWDILPIMTKFRAIILGKFEDIDYNINVRAIDQESNKTRDEAKLTIMIESKYKEMLTSFRNAIGKSEDPDIKDAKLPYVPKSMEELEMMTSMGALKLAWEISMDYLLHDTHMKVNWPELKKRLFEDIVDLGMCAVKDYQDPQTNLPGVRYVDPANLLIRQSLRGDYYDVTQAGEIVWMTVEELRSWGLSEEEIREAVFAYQNNWGNTWGYSTYGSGWQESPRLDGIRVAVLDQEFQSFDRQFYEGRMMGEGMVPIELPHGAKKATNKKNKFWTKEKPKFYRCKWIVGTKTIFDYGLQYDVPYKQTTKARCSYSCTRVTNRSIINQCISVIDDFQIAVYKLRNAMAEAPPAGVKIDWASISNVTSGGGKLDPWEVMRIYRNRGDIIYKSAINPNNGMPLQGSGNPIETLTGGIGPFFGELTASMELYMNMIRDITGLNAVVDSSAPAPGQLVGTAKIAETATNHVLRPLLSGYKTVKQSCFVNVTNRWQIVAKFYPQDLTTSLNNAAFETVKVTSALYEPVFDVYCDAIISDEDKMKLENAMLASMQAAKTGSVGITMRDYYYLNQLSATGNIRYAWVYLSYREEEVKKEAAENAAATQAQIGEQNMMLQQRKEQFELEKIRVEEEEKRKTLAVEFAGNLRIKMAEAKFAPKPAPATTS